MLYQLWPKLVGLAYAKAHPLLPLFRTRAPRPGKAAHRRKRGILHHLQFRHQDRLRLQDVLAQIGGHEPAHAEHPLDEVVDAIEGAAGRAAHDRDHPPAALDRVTVFVDDLARGVAPRADSQRRHHQANLHPLRSRRVFGSDRELRARCLEDVGLQFLRRAHDFDGSARGHDDAGPGASLLHDRLVAARKQKGRQAREAQPDET